MKVLPDDDTGCAWQVFREPVITPSGLSYEQSALQEHLSKARFPSVNQVQTHTQPCQPLWKHVQSHQPESLCSLPDAYGCR